MTTPATEARAHADAHREQARATVEALRQRWAAEDEWRQACNAAVYDVRLGRWVGWARVGRKGETNGQD